MQNLDGKVAAITGAGSGIGRALALRLAAEGCELSLSDIDSSGLASTERLVAGTHPGCTVTTTEVDVADRDAVSAWAAATVAHHGRVNLVVNNAGVALGATVADMSYDDLEWLMGINFYGVVYGTKEFLPHLRDAGEGHIVNVSSVFGLMGIPTQSAYNAAKFAVRGFTEALRIELDIEQCGVSATTVHPGGIKTNIARNARMTERDGLDMESARGDMEKAFITSPDTAAKVIVGAVRRDLRRVLVGPDAYVFNLLASTSPRLYQRIVGLGARRQMN